MQVFQATYKVGILFKNYNKQLEMLDMVVMNLSEKNITGCSIERKEGKCGRRNQLASCGQTPGKR